MMDVHAFDNVANVLNPDCFYSKENRLIYEAIVDLHNENSPVDILTTTHKIKANGNLVDVGGAAYISDLTSRVASTANLEYHSFLLRQMAVQRKVMDESNSMFTAVREVGADPFEAVDQFVQTMESYTASILSPTRDIVVAAESVAQRYDMVASGINPPGSVLTYIPELDDKIIRIEPGENVIIAARPGMGKTALALKICLNLALRNYPVAFLSAEMNEEELVKRLAIYLSGVNPMSVKRGKLTRSEEESFKTALKQITRLPLYIVAAAGVPIERLMGIVKGLEKRKSIKLVAADYVQLFGTVRNLDGREKYSHISHVWNNTIKSLKLPGLLLSQLTRKVEESATKEPQLHHLMETGSLEADANIVLMLMRPEYYGAEAANVNGEQLSAEGLLVGYVRKNRDGTTSEIAMRWDKGTVTGGEEVEEEVKNPF